MIFSRISSVFAPLSLVCVTLALPETASAQKFLKPEEDTNRSGLLRHGLGVEAGVGVANFLDADAAQATGAGPAWTARVTLGTRRVLAGEFAYIGESHEVNTLGLDDDATLIASGLEAAARLALANIDIGSTNPWVLKPYAVAGLAWKHFDLTQADFNTSNVAENDDVFDVPLGVGLSWRYKQLLLDQRFVLRPTFGSDLFDGSTVEDQSLGTWSLTARAGFEF